MLIAVLMYFALACTLAGLLLFPGARSRLLGHVGSAVDQVRTLRLALRKAAVNKAGDGIVHAGEAARSGSSWLRTHWRGVSIGVGLLLVPPALVFSLRSLHTLDAFDDSSAVPARNVVASLLEGEQLVPPPPLPPEVFTTAEVELVRPLLGDADRRWDLLDAEFRKRLLVAYRLMQEEHGYQMVLIEGYRSPERQALLARMGSNVTNATAWQSYHQYGRAADSAFMRNGKLVISERDPWAMKGYELYGEVAQRVGLTWGGRWQNADLGHVELRDSVVPLLKVGR